MSTFQGIGGEGAQQLLGEDIEEWQCPQCGHYAYTLKSKGALMVKCPNHTGSLWWMRKTAQEEEES